MFFREPITIGWSTAWGVFIWAKVVDALREKGELISNEESEALQIALLFHDIGHGPFSCYRKSITS